MKIRMLLITKWAAALGLALFTLPGSLMAQEDSTGFIAQADTYIRSSGTDKSVSYGDKTVFYVRNSSSAYQQIGLIRFDASTVSLPATVQLDSAKVFLTTGTVLNSVVNVSLISIEDSYDSWDEMAINYNSLTNGDIDTVGTIAVTRVGAKSTRYSWDVTDHLREELVNGNKLISLAVFQNYNTGANTTFVTTDSVTGNINKPLLALFTHAVPVKVVYLSAAPDMAGHTITLNWQTPAESNTNYAVVERSTDGVSFTQVSGQIAAKGTAIDTTDYNYIDNSPVVGYTNYYRIKYTMTTGVTYTSDVIATAFFDEVAVLEDAYVQLANNGTNHGTEVKLLVKNDGNSSYSRNAYLKFDLSGFTGTPQAVKLRLHVNSANSGIGSVNWFLWNVNDHTWTQDLITGKNAPALTDSSMILTSRPAQPSGVVDFDIPLGVVSAALAGDKILSLAITSDDHGSTDDASFVSSDSSDVSLHPLIVISQDVKDNVTPVNLSKLTASQNNQGITLHWKAYTELNTAYFTVQRSADAKSFENIGQLEARGTATTAKSYQFTDALPLAGINYYRIMAVDINGDLNYGDIAGIKYRVTASATANGWKLYPNPVGQGQALSVEFSMSGVQPITARLIDLAGSVRLVQKLSVKSMGSATISTAAVPSGIYYVQLLSADGHTIGQNRKVIVK